ncbi:hypothetical protein CR513_40452, partial [Mucuna pruriens]
SRLGSSSSFRLISRRSNFKIVSESENGNDGPFIITHVFPYGVVELEDENTNNIVQVNGYRSNSSMKVSRRQWPKWKVSFSLISQIKGSSSESSPTPVPSQAWTDFDSVSIPLITRQSQKTMINLSLGGHSKWGMRVSELSQNTPQQKPRPADVESEPEANSPLPKPAGSVPLPFPNRTLSTRKSEIDEDLLKMF